MTNIYFDDSLSLKEKGLWYLLATANGFDHTPTIGELVKFNADGKTAIANAMHGLIEKGFVKKEIIRDNGRIVGVKYQIKRAMADE